MHHANTALTAKQRLYEWLESMEKELSRGCNIHIIGGDFNARLILRTPAERRVLGPWIFNPMGENLDILSAHQLENRELFLDFCLQNKYTVANAWFEKSEKDLVTFRSTQTQSFDEPLSTDRFAQMDFVLYKDQWKNTCQNVDASTEMPFESDHKAMTTTTCLKLRKKDKVKENKHTAMRYRKPDEERFENLIPSWENLQERPCCNKGHSPLLSGQSSSSKRLKMNSRRSRRSKSNLTSQAALGL